MLEIYIYLLASICFVLLFHFYVLNKAYKVMKFNYVHLRNWTAIQLRLIDKTYLVITLQDIPTGKCTTSKRIDVGEWHLIDDLLKYKEDN